MTETIFTAAKIYTFNGYRPVVDAVLVRDGWIVCAGSVDECRSWSDAPVDDRFAGKILMPGMVEAHGHTAEGVMIGFPYVGFYDIPRPDGSTAKGVTSYEQLLEVLRAEDAVLPEGDPLVAAGFDPIFFAGQPRLSREHLDQVSTTRPIFVRHASGHLATVNSAMIAAEGITADCGVEGVDVDDDGELTGELQEAEAMMLAKSGMLPMLKAGTEPQGIVDYGRLCRNAGVTTTSELVGTALIAPQTADIYDGVVNDPSFPARMAIYNMPGVPGKPVDYDEVAAQAVALKGRNTDKVRYGGIKLVQDGSLQGWTACCSSPGYYTGEDQGLALFGEELPQIVRTFHESGLQIYCHANGDAAADQFIDAVDQALRHYAWLDHRHTVQHSQVTRASQYRRMATLGIAANIFTNHIWYWGDQHRDVVMGPEIVERMWASRTAMDLGVSVTFHSDSGVTPTGQLHTAWCAVKRQTPSGRVLGEAQKVSVDEALRAVTIEAAYQLHMDDEIGSIEAGKRADFAVLEADPYEVELRDVPVWGTVLGGEVFEAERPQ